MRLRLFGFLTSIALFVGSQVNAQAYGTDSLQCMEKLSVFYEFAKAKNYVDAFEPWYWVYQNCPAAHKNTFIQGPNIVEGMIKATTDETKKAELTQLLYNVWSDRNKYFPGQEGYVLGKLGSEMMSYEGSERFGEAFGYLQQSIELDGNSTSASVLLYFVKAAAYRFNADELTKIDIIDIYQQVDQIISINLEDEDTRNDKYYSKASEGIESMLGPFLECDDLVKVYTEKLDDLKADVGRMARAANLLEKKECTDSDIFFTLSEALYAENPSASSAYRMGTMSYTRLDYNKAIEYFKAGMDLDDNDDRKADYALRIATAYTKIDSKANARSFAMKAAGLRSGWGDPYLLIGDLYASTKGCGTNEFEVKSVFWAAIDKYEYARFIDPSVADAATQRIKNSKVHAPDKTLTFQYGKLEANTVSVGCWINEDAKVRLD